MNASTGRTLAGCGCLTWLACVLLVVVFSVVAGMGILPDALISLSMPVQAGSSCCASLGFLVGLVGIVLMFVGKSGDAD
jgi:hypothetical protein